MQRERPRGSGGGAGRGVVSGVQQAGEGSPASPVMAQLPLEVATFSSILLPPEDTWHPHLRRLDRAQAATGRGAPLHNLVTS